MKKAVKKPSKSANPKKVSNKDFFDSELPDRFIAAAVPAYLKVRREEEEEQMRADETIRKLRF